MPPQPLIQVNHLTHHYGERPAVQALSFELHAGEVLGLLGPNGAGKSSTMNMLSGYMDAESGDIKIAGYDLRTQPLLAKQQLGYLPEQAPLYMHMRVDAYLDFCAQLHGITGAAVGAARDRVKQSCGLSSVGRRLIGQLSKGYKQRVGIAQALIHDPKVLLLDEPTVGLDPQQLHEIRALITALSQDRGIVLSSHILPEITSTCQRVLIMVAGRAVYSGSLQALTQDQQCLRISLQANPSLTALQQLPGVLNAQALDGHSWELRLRPEAQSEQARANIAKAIVEQGWGLLELNASAHSLEQVFLRLTSQEAAPTGDLH